MKAAIEATNDEMKVEFQKLIHSGKVLKDEQTLAEVGVKENDFLVIMLSKVSLVFPHMFYT